MCGKHRSAASVLQPVLIRAAILSSWWPKRVHGAKDRAGGTAADIAADAEGVAG